ncbi:calmodulin-like protein 4 isoform X1 [Panthera leo]|uniref:calmodulin-like protein 4 isoform X1 n=1 Tax=Panthera leo TaxID=9689 RepID=UPI001C6A8047|nr:calmodulin-like protein 4 isoform X1 [Panthera leo]XP_042797519.1 calmodulin-like protein 4 isoform X1 [Panthera leo]XP_042797520.1 calmodulin-like protein 4 isoform X1 [Panthera leo]
MSPGGALSAASFSPSETCRPGRAVAGHQLCSGKLESDPGTGPGLHGSRGFITGASTQLGGLSTWSLEERDRTGGCGSREPTGDSLRPRDEYKECFSLYDKQQRGKIKATDLMVVMRCLGASPTPGEVQRHLQTHGIDRNGELDFSTFLTIMHTQIKQEDPKKEILLAMLMADKEKKGYIMASELRSKLMTLGEKLTHKEVDDLFREAEIEPNGKVKYDEFIDKITIPVQDY